MTTDKHVLCNICGIDDFSVLYPAGVAQIQQIVRCNQCGLIYVNPRPGLDLRVIRDYGVPEKALVGRVEKEKLQVNDYYFTKKYLSELFPQRGRLLEVGSGFGYLLDYFKKDSWDVLGIEPWPEGCLYSKEMLGIEALTCTLEEAGLDGSSFDVILMMHVIEHVPNPLETLCEVYRVLKPDGCFVMETPRYNTLMHKFLGKRERNLSIDGHVYFFSTDTLAKICSMAGFELHRRDYVGRSLSANRLIQIASRISKSHGITKFLTTLSDLLQLNNVRLHVNMRDVQRVYLRKPGQKIEGTLPQHIRPMKISLPK